MDKRIILITGTSSGLGRALVENISEDYVVYGTCRDLSKVDPLAQKKNYKILPLDMSVFKTIDKVVDTIIKEEGRIDILVNNVGQGFTGALEEALQKDATGVFQTNYFGPVYLMQKVLPVMREQKKGLIVNITSVAAYMGLPFRSFYSASKAALDITTESLRMEISRSGVDVINIAPGEMSTEIASRRCNTPVKKDSFYELKYRLALEKMDEDVSKGADPNDAARKVIAIIENSSRGVRYTVGNFLERFAVVLKKMLPSKWFEAIMKLFYKI